MNKKIIEILTEAVGRISREFQEEPLNGDEVEVITERFRVELDLNQGNITKDDSDYKSSVDKCKHRFKE